MRGGSGGSKWDGRGRGRDGFEIRIWEDSERRRMMKGEWLSQTLHAPSAYARPDQKLHPARLRPLNCDSMNTSLPKKHSGLGSYGRGS